MAKHDEGAHCDCSSDLCCCCGMDIIKVALEKIRELCAEHHPHEVIFEEINDIICKAINGHW